MAEWDKTIQQTFEYYVVDPGTWKDVKLLDNVKSCTISRDGTADTLGSATIDTVDTLGECYVRVYMITIQNGIREKHPLGTFLVQTPSSSFNGKIREVTMDAYTPLLELKEKQPPVGYHLLENDNIMDYAYRLVRENARAPVTRTESQTKLNYDFISDTSDTWMTFLTDLISNAKYEFALDEMGRILFSPKQDTASLQPVWTYDDDNSSILYPDVTMNHDLYGVPNVVEIIFSRGFYNEETGSKEYHVRIVNDDENSPISIQNRGREIIHREINPNITGSTEAGVTKSVVIDYAKQLLKNLSSVEYSVSYTHGYCPVRIGDCVRLNYTRAGLNNIKAKVISQTIKCIPGCPVTEKAVFTTNLWG